MLENIIIDNHRISYPHIHPNPEKHYLKEEINLTDGSKVYNKVMDHIEENEGLDIEKLIGELKE